MVDIPDQFREHVLARLDSDLICWLTTVRPSGAPDTVPIWYVWSDPEIIVFSEPGKPKLRNIEQNPHVSVALDDTRHGDDVVRFEGTARVEPDRPTPDRVPAYVAKYSRRIAELGYGDPPSFAEMYSVPVVITPTRFRRWV